MEISFEGWRVPPGFKSDGCTVPWFLRWLLRADRFSKCCTLHDFLRRHGIVSTSDADDVLKRYIMADGGSVLHAYIYWLGVRLTSRYYTRILPLPKEWAEYAVRKA